MTTTTKPASSAAAIPKPAPTPEEQLKTLEDTRLALNEEYGKAMDNADEAKNSPSGLAAGHDAAHWDGVVEKLRTKYSQVERGIGNVITDAYNYRAADTIKLQNGVLWAKDNLAQAKAANNATEIAVWDKRVAQEEAWLAGTQGAKNNIIRRASETLWELGPQKGVAALRADIAASAAAQPFAGVGARYGSVEGATLWGDGTIKGNLNPDISDQLIGPDVKVGDPRNPSGLGAAVRQGKAGNCVFDSTLTAMAAKNPNFVKSMVRPDPSGLPNAYQVRFFAKEASTGEMKPQWVSVDDTIPLNDDGTPKYNKIPLDGGNRPILGMALIEKAFAKFNDQHKLHQNVEAGYGMAGGRPADIMGAVTGNEGQGLGPINNGGKRADRPLLDYPPDVVAGVLALANGPGARPVTAAVSTETETVLGGKLQNDHNYTVLGTVVKNGETMVNLRNPWGAEVAGKLGSNANGVFSLSLKDFQENFSNLVVGW